MLVRYQYKREPLTPDEANRLANACQTHEEKLIVWTLLDTGLRVAELAPPHYGAPGLAEPPADDLRQGRPLWKTVQALGHPPPASDPTDSGGTSGLA